MSVVAIALLGCAVGDACRIAQGIQAKAFGSFLFGQATPDAVGLVDRQCMVAAP